MFYHQHGQTTKSSNKSLQKRQQTTNRPAPQANTTHPAALIQRAKLSPNSLNADDVLTLQGAIGNRAASRLLAGQSATQVQAKLTIGEPGDKYEQEADRVASQVVEQLHAPASAESAQGQSVQRQDIEDEELQAKPEITALQRMDIEDEELQAKPSISDLQRVPLTPEVQREAMLEDDDLQAKSILQRQEAIDGGDASTDLESSINRARGSGQPLDTGLQQSMGQAMGTDFSGVKVHTDAQSDQLNQSIQARAFTTGQDVFFRQGEYNPGSRGGQELIAHELTHVVQQGTGGKEIQKVTLPEEASISSLDFRDVGNGVYATNVTTRHSAVADLVRQIDDYLNREQIDMNIVILSGCHGEPTGDLVENEDDFYQEDRMLEEEYECNVVNMNELGIEQQREAMRQNLDEAVLILSWCYSEQTYEHIDTYQIIGR